MIKHKYQINHVIEQYNNIQNNILVLNPEYKYILENSMKITVTDQLG